MNGAVGGAAGKIPGLDALGGAAGNILGLDALEGAAGNAASEAGDAAGGLVGLIPKN